MDLNTLRANHIEDYLVQLYPYQWITWTNSKDKTYANLRLTTEYGVKGSMVSNPRTLPSELDCTNGLKVLQDAWDLQNDSYKSNRRKEYPSIADQLDDIYHNGINAWKATIKTTKDKYPKG